ncbi:hypothetical protein Q4578_11745 [Shimia thalassica]|uniref:hypothetical protein n=1 Tax=Shimia thalassica TaxID=1715693 RepID=UPI0026E352B2|nr:hypothetical protein [Shimia thalassica]MDO6522264.1 hypothetical protein [Shimia thalassica]
MSDTPAPTLHPLAPEHLPGFLPDATGHDPIMVHMIFFVAVMIFLLVTAFLHLHSLPEKLAHKVGATQLQIVGILGLIALFTHNNLYWVAALLLAVVQIPDYETPLLRIADALDRQKSPEPAPQPQPQSAPKEEEA